MKTKARFNIIDFLIIIVVIGCIIGVALRYELYNKMLSSNKDEVEISFFINGVRIGSTEAMVEGDIFYWKQNGLEIGKLLSKEVSNREVFVLDNEYNYVKKYDDRRYDVRGVIVSKGIIKEDGFKLNGTQFLAPGKTFEVQSKNITVYITITDIKKINT
ncbi:MAG: DUF4330 family protein [Oscillospiraceae bacterium]|nr:DUF4330 family protein [Oscillospiraceae bacterium]